MRKVVWLFMPALLVVAAACAVHTIRPARLLKPEGERIKVILSDGSQHEGELLEATSESVLFEEEGRPVVACRGDVERVEVVEYRLSFNQKEWGEIRLYARYAQGLSDGQRAELLRSYGVDESLPLTPTAPASK